MNLALIVMLLAVVSFRRGTSAPSTAPSGDSPVVNFTRRYGSPDEYVVLGASSSWSLAEAMCKRKNAQLLKLNDAGDEQYVRELLHTYGITDGYYEFFIGLTKEKHAVGWSWRYDELPLNYWEFEPGYLPPNISKDGRCCSFGKSSGAWFPRGCHHKTLSPMHVICQRPKQEHYTCHDHPCRHGGVCISQSPILQGSNFTCQCMKGFGGSKCEVEADECESSPCRNGYCLNGIGDFHCECDEGFTGKTCEANIDDCQYHRCHNNGTCQDGVASYTCLCPEFYSGTFCEQLDLPTPELYQHEPPSDEPINDGDYDHLQGSRATSVNSISVLLHILALALSTANVLLFNA